MRTRTQRLLAIRRIIEKDAIGNQEELLKRLDGAGFELTQATLSRDLKYLQVGKVPDKKLGYVYILPGENTEAEQRIPKGSFPLNGFISMEFAQNMAVIKTWPGYANSIASAIDELNAFEILGTIAGDDTILLIPRDGVSQEDVRNALVKIIPSP
jgi:transcriptional regulator of arginine metabolism